MKNIIKMLENSSVIYRNRASLTQALNHSSFLPNKCIDVTNLIKNNANAYDIQVAFDNIIITDETIRTFANNIAIDVKKQLDGISEEGFLDGNLSKIKQSSSTNQSYIKALKNLITKINDMIKMLKQADIDLDEISKCTSNIEGHFESLVNNLQNEDLDKQIFISRYISILQSKSPLHTKTINEIVNTKININKTIQMYNLISSQIRREIDIVQDLENIDVQQMPK